VEDMNPPDREPTPAAHLYRVFGVPAGGDQGEQLLKTFERGFEAAAFAKLVSAGGRYLRVRVETLAGPGGQVGGREGMSKEPLQVPPRPGCLFKLAYISSLLGGAFVSLVLGFAGAFYIVIWLFREAGLALGPRVVVAIALAFAAGLTALVVKIHATVFREPRVNSRARDDLPGTGVTGE